MNFVQAKKDFPLLDVAVTSLVEDLHDRGLADDVSVIVWGEFGRTPFREGRTAEGSILGRDHFPDCYSIWMCGGGIRPGMIYGATDELGYSAVDSPVDVHDIHATLLRQLGIDHTRLSVKFQGLDVRLTGIAGRVIQDII